MSEFADYLYEVFERFGPIAVRSMFGGYGVFHDGLMFALVADEMLYLKVDRDNIRDFEERNLGRFEYRRKGKVTPLSYYLAPPEVMEDREEAARWARRSFEAAQRSARSKPLKKRRV